MVATPETSIRLDTGETIAVELRMSRPVQIVGDGTPSIEIDIGGTNRTATLRRIHHSNDHFYYSLHYPPWGRGDTLRFEHVVAQGDSAAEGFTVPRGAIAQHGAVKDSIIYKEGGEGAQFRSSIARAYPAMEEVGRPVNTVPTSVTSVEWYGNQVWVHFDRDLDPASQIDKARSQFTPAFSVSGTSPTPVVGARIVRGRGAASSCLRGDSGCRTVRLALAPVHRPDALSTNPWRSEPATDETVWMSYTPHAGLPKLRLRDTVNHDVAAFSRVQATALDVHYRVHDEESTVRIDPWEFEEVARQLVANAVDAMGPGGRIVVSVDRTKLNAYRAKALGVAVGTHVRVRITDNGPGISEELRPHVFEPFFTTRGAETGRGLGLAIAYSLVRRWNASLSVQSAPEEGAMFEILIPVVEAGRT